LRDLALTSPKFLKVLQDTIVNIDPWKIRNAFPAIANIPELIKLIDLDALSQRLLFDKKSGALDIYEVERWLQSANKHDHLMNAIRSEWVQVAAQRFFEKNLSQEVASLYKLVEDIPEMKDSIISDRDMIFIAELKIPNTREARESILITFTQ